MSIRRNNFKRIKFFLNGETKTLFLPLKIVNFIKKIKRIKDTKGYKIDYIVDQYENDPDLKQNRAGFETNSCAMNNMIGIGLENLNERIAFSMINNQFVYAMTQNINKFGCNEMYKESFFRLEKFLLI